MAFQRALKDREGSYESAFGTRAGPKNEIQRLTRPSKFCGQHQAKDLIRPLKGLIRPLKGLVRPFKGLIRPFKGLIRPFKGLIRPLKGKPFKVSV